MKCQRYSFTVGKWCLYMAFFDPTKTDIERMCEKIDEFAELNYSKKRIQNSEKVKEHLYNRGLLTP